MGWCTELDLHDLWDNGHHLARTPDGKCDDFNMSIADFVARNEGCNTECVDGGEAEVMSYSGTPEDAVVRYSLFNFIYDGGRIIEGEFIAKGKLVKEDSNCIIFVINELTRD